MSGVVYEINGGGLCQIRASVRNLFLTIPISIFVTTDFLSCYRDFLHFHFASLWLYLYCYVQIRFLYDFPVGSGVLCSVPICVEVIQNITIWLWLVHASVVPVLDVCFLPISNCNRNPLAPAMAWS